MRVGGRRGSSGGRSSQDEKLSQAGDRQRVEASQSSLGGELPPLDLGEPLADRLLEGEILPPLKSVCGCPGHGPWQNRPGHGSNSPLEEECAEAVEEAGDARPEQKQSDQAHSIPASRRPIVTAAAAGVPGCGQGRPVRGRSRRRVRQGVGRYFGRFAAAGGLALMVLTTTADLSPPVNAVVAWATPGPSAASGEGASVAIERRVAGAFDQNAGRTAVTFAVLAMADVERLDETGQVTQGTPKFAVPERAFPEHAVPGNAINVHPVELAPVDQRHFPHFPDLAGRSIRPEMMQTAVQSMSAAGLAAPEVVGSAVTANAVTANDAEPRPVTPVIEPVVAIEHAQPTPVRAIEPLPRSVAAVAGPSGGGTSSGKRAVTAGTRKVAAPALHPTSTSTKVSPEGPRQPGVRDNRVSVPMPLRLVYASPRNSRVGEGSLKDAPARKAVTEGGAAGIVSTGALALTAYRGQMPASKPVTPHPQEPAEGRSGESWQAVPAWAQGWLLARTEPIEAFRKTD